MRKKYSLLSLLFFSCIFSGCSIVKQDINDEQSITASINTVTENVSETVTVEDLTQVKPTDTVKTEEAERKVIWIAPDGEVFYEDDGVAEGSIIVFDKAVYRPSTGVCYDSDINPLFFDNENYDFLGEPIEYNEDDWFCVKSGDKINGYTVKEAETVFNICEEGYLKEDGYVPMSNSILFEDNITLTGYLLYYSYDDPTFIQRGDLFFSPDESYAGMPLVDFYPYSSVKSGENFFDFDELIFPVVYSDSLNIRVGNLFYDYSDNEALKKIIGDGDRTVKTKVEITLEEVYLIFGDMMRSWGTSAKIIDVEELK